MSIYIQIEFWHNSIWLIVRRYWVCNQFNSETNSTDNIRVWFILIRFIMNWYADISWSLWHSAQVQSISSSLHSKCFIFNLNVNWIMCILFCWQNILNIRIFIASFHFIWMAEAVHSRKSFLHFKNLGWALLKRKVNAMSCLVNIILLRITIAARWYLPLSATEAFLWL